MKKKSERLKSLFCDFWALQIYDHIDSRHRFMLYIMINYGCKKYSGNRKIQFSQTERFLYQNVLLIKEKRFVSILHPRSICLVKIHQIRYDITLK